MTAFKQGMLVEHTKRPDWGPGKIVHISGIHMHVIFRDLEEDMAKVFPSSSDDLRPANQQTDDILDNMPPCVEKSVEGRSRWVLPAKRYVFESLKKKFLPEFPLAFNDPNYHANERDTKLAAHVAFKQQLGMDTDARSSPGAPDDRGYAAGVSGYAEARDADAIKIRERGAARRPRG